MDIDTIAGAIGDPGKYLSRREGERITHWSARAVMEILEREREKSEHVHKWERWDSFGDYGWVCKGCSQNREDDPLCQEWAWDGHEVQVPCPHCGHLSLYHSIEERCTRCASKETAKVRRCPICREMRVWDTNHLPNAWRHQSDSRWCDPVRGTSKYPDDATTPPEMP